MARIMRLLKLTVEIRVIAVTRPIYKLALKLIKRIRKIPRSGLIILSRVMITIS